MARYELRWPFPGDVPRHASLGHGGGGATLLAVLAAREAARDGGVIVVIDRDQQFYPPAAAAWGIPLARTILLRPTNSRDADWALDQTLRTPGVAAVLDWPRKLDPRAQRRLQLAAETCGVVGLLVRNAAAAQEPSWAQVPRRRRPGRGAGSWSPLAT